MGEFLKEAKRASAKPLAPLVFIYGEGGEGKTTFASGAPNPLIIAAEDGARRVRSQAMILPGEGVVQSWEDALGMVREVRDQPHDYRTLVIDSVGALEVLLIAEVVKKSGKSSYEKMGWGKDDVVKAEWRLLKSMLEDCRNKRGMTIVLIGHAKAKTIHDPTLGDYSSFVADLMPPSWDTIYNWVDIVGFLRRDMARVEAGNGKARALMGSGGRMLHTERGNGFAAKQRAGYRLPAKLALPKEAAWDTFAAALAAGDETAATVKARIAELAAKADRVKEAGEYVADAGEDVMRLREIENGLRVFLADKEAA